MQSNQAQYFWEYQQSLTFEPNENLKIEFLSKFLPSDYKSFIEKLNYGLIPYFTLTFYGYKIQNDMIREGDFKLEIKSTDDDHLTIMYGTIINQKLHPNYHQSEIY